jgi:hypothetical protein
MIKNIALFCLAILTTSFAHGKLRKVERLKRDKAPNIKLAYFGRFQYRGEVIGTEFMLNKRHVTYRKFKRKNENFVCLNTNLTYEPDLYNIGTVYAEMLKRSTHLNTGIYAEIALGFGIGKGFNKDQPKTYIRNTDGSETIKKSKTRFIMATVNAGVGYDFAIKQNRPIKLFAKGGLYPILFDQFPYQTKVRIELGVNASMSVFKKKKK